MIQLLINIFDYCINTMKKILSMILVGAGLVAAAQPKKAPKMAPVLEVGYYLNGKGDTVKGEIQTNPDDELSMYHTFGFKPAKGGKVMPVDTKKAKAYAFGDKQFERIVFDGVELFVEVLAKGRLNLYEIRDHGKIDGNDAIIADYFIQDNRAEGEDIGLKEIKRLNHRFYKKDLKPYMKDQINLWNDLDKYTFNKPAVTAAVIEFNKFYRIGDSKDKE